MSFQRVQTVRLSERIVEQIETAVVTGDLKPGSRLPSERELVTQFGASRSTVREALRVLESNGVIRSRHGDPNGPEVLPFSSDRLAKQMRMLAHVEQLNLTELVSFRMILDRSANLLAARLRTEDELAAMEQRIEEMAAAVEVDDETFSQADFAFHEEIARASRNRLIQVCTEVVRGVVLSLISDRITRSASSTDLMRRSLQHHRDVLAAIRDGDGPRAARMAQHSLYDYYADYVDDAERESLQALLEPDHAVDVGAAPQADSVVSPRE